MSRSQDTVGVIVGRFQVPELTIGHNSLIRRVAERHKNVLIMIGTTVTRGTDTNPLDYETRRKLFRDEMVHDTKFYTFEIPDASSDEVWSEALDARIGYANGGKDAVLYGSRDSFIKHYTGKYPTVVLDEVPGVSGTALRETTGKQALASDHFRAGVIYSTQQRYPISFQTVDVAILDLFPLRILLGRKRGETLYRFPGGFVDPTDESLEAAARREAKEETGLDIADVTYLGSFRVDDSRYRRDKDKIMTAFFMAKANSVEVQTAVASDDLEEVRWFEVVQIEQIVPNHRMLAHKLSSVLSGIQ